MTAPLPWTRLLALTALVLLVHAWLLAGLPAGLGGRDASSPAALQVRQIQLQPPAPVAPAAPVVERPRPPKPPAAPAAPVPAPEPPMPAEIRGDVPQDKPVDPPPPPAEPASAALAVATPTDAPPAAEPVAPPAATAPAGDRLPTYATRLPDPLQARYELRRGLLGGEGELTWRHGPEGYELRIEGGALGLRLLSWHSRGGVDAAGLAPLRFVDQRGNRAPRAANFQRDKGLVTYSGSTVEHPLLPGAQDRLSWMLQLAGIVEADPARWVAGERVQLWVAGARGDGDAWTFVVAGHEAVDLAGARAERALLLRREPRKPYDTRVEVWLDPARQHLPVRLKLGSAAGDDALEFLLKP